MKTGTPAFASRPPLQAVTALLASADLPTADLTDQHCESFFFAGDLHAPEGLVGLEFHGDAALLRSLVVTASRRGTGLGAKLLQHAEARARARGVRRVYLLTTTAEGFFAHHGYSRAPREAAPEAIRATREFTGLCPAGAVFMVRTL